MSEEQKKDFEEAMVARQQVEEKILVKAWEDQGYKQELASRLDTLLLDLDLADSMTSTGSVVSLSCMSSSDTVAKVDQV